MQQTSSNARGAATAGRTPGADSQRVIFSKALRQRARLRAVVNDSSLLAPPLVLVGLFVIVPIFVALYLSFTNWTGFTPPTPAGLSNYVRLSQDRDVQYSLQLTAIIAVVGTIVCNVLGLGVALLVNGNSKFNSLMRVLVFYPYVIGPIIIGFLWSSILGSNGAINALLHSWGGEGFPFFADPTWAAVSVIAVIIWSSFGVNVILYLAGLQTIPESLVEAALIDGASAWQTFWRVKLPVLAPTVTLNIVLPVIGLLRVYELILALTEGGPAGTTRTLVYNILNISFRNTQFGYGAAQSVVLMIVIIIITLLIIRLRRRSEEAVAA